MPYIESEARVQNFREALKKVEEPRHIDISLGVPDILRIAANLANIGAREYANPGREILKHKDEIDLYLMLTKFASIPRSKDGIFVASSPSIVPPGVPEIFTLSYLLGSEPQTNILGVRVVSYLDTKSGGYWGQLICARLSPARLIAYRHFTTFNYEETDDAIANFIMCSPDHLYTGRVDVPAHDISPEVLQQFDKLLQNRSTDTR